MRPIAMHAPADASEDGSAGFSDQTGLEDQAPPRRRRPPGRAPKFEAEKLWAVVKPLYLAGFSVRDIAVHLKTNGMELSRERVRVLIVSRRKATRVRP